MDCLQPETPAPEALVRIDVAPSSDERLLEGLARGDRALANELHRRLLRSVDATLYRVLGRRDAGSALK